MLLQLGRRESSKVVIRTLKNVCNEKVDSKCENKKSNLEKMEYSADGTMGTALSSSCVRGA